MSDDKIRTGLWKKDGPNGSYYGGKVEIDGQLYYLDLYRNDRKTEDKHPDLNLQIKPAQQRSAPPPSRPGDSRPQRQAQPAPLDDDLPF